MADDTTRIGDEEVFQEAVVLSDGSTLSGIKIGDLISLIGTLLKNGLVADVANIISLINTPGATFAQILEAFINIIKKIFPQGPTPPKTFAFASYEKKRHHTKEEIEEMIRKEGGDPGDKAKFSPFILLILQFMPLAIELIRSLLNKNKGT